MHASGTTFVSTNGTVYLAREAYEYEGEVFQYFSILYPDGSTGVTGEADFQKDSRIVWAPSGTALPVDTEQYVDRQEQVSSALALIDDLVQDAGDLGNNALMHTLANAYHAVEQFRVLGKRAN